VAPLTSLFLLVVQVVALFIPTRRLRLALTSGCTVGIAAIFVYVAAHDQGPSEGVDLGEILVGFWFAASAVLLVVALIRETFGSAWH
jgi:hypothetical protein